MKTTCNHRIMLVGSGIFAGLESSYRTAFEALGCAVSLFDLESAVDRYCRLGRLGRTFNAFVPVEPWIRKANREMVLHAIHMQPDLVVIVGKHSVRPGALAQLRASTSARIFYIWPDTLVNLDVPIVSAFPLCDLVATYSKATVGLLRRLGAPRVEWAPLAADLGLHASPSVITSSGQKSLRADVSFIGGWRPEREELLSQLGDIPLKIWGPDWGRRCRGNPAIMRAWQQRAVRGPEYAQAVRASKVNLNIIDPTNYPAANMRFFEIPAAGGLQLSSSCPEMESEFQHGEHVFYYKGPSEAQAIIRRLLSDDMLRNKVAEAGHQKVLARHTYTQRAQQILSWVEEDSLAH